ncbi:MAG: pseudouridine synthase [Myxococcota bacterium]
MSRPRARTAHRSDAASRGVRLQKLLAAAGLGSRRACEELIQAGRVRVNGKVVRELGTRARPERDRISVDGRRIPRRPAPKSYLVYKPRGVVTTTRDPRARRTVIDLVPSGERLFPVGRLDAQSEGLLLLTNDGELADLLLHPSHGVPRVYRVSVQGRVRTSVLRQLTRGVDVDGRNLRALAVELQRSEEGRSVLEITLVEGRRHQLRKMLRVVGHPVRRLVRVRFGPLRLGRLRPGEWRRLRPSEARALERMRARPALEGAASGQLQS